MGHYLDFLRARREEGACVESVGSVKSQISSTYVRNNGGAPCVESPSPGGDGVEGAEWLEEDKGLSTQEAAPFNAAKPLKNGFYRFERFDRTFSALERRCPAHVDLGSWRQTVEDGRRFLSRWGEQAEALDWSPRHLFGLAPVPEKPPANYRRLSRYDETGLLWLLRGRPVVALTAATAAIQCPSGSILTYRRHNKPVLGPLGDSLEDFA
jgi:hypothetical protein